MGQALYRKYRSKSLSEIVGQEHITTALKHALKSGQISHAYLFTGPRGVGKTSIARILAHELNQVPYDETATHLDIIEIDAASNRRIDEIRELRDRVHNAPTSGKYKVYIIDEVHMLTREAFNALLKTLEEPPAHAIFILATTEAHKLPETIVSRTQRYTFRPIELTKAVEHLRSIAKKEKISIDDDALQLLAEHGEGSFRDSISLLDQVRNTSELVTLDSVRQSLGIAPSTAIESLISALESRDSSTIINELQAMQLQGYHAASIAKQLSEQLRSQLLTGQSRLAPTLLSQLLRALLDVPSAQDGMRLLEITLLEATLATQQPESHVASIEIPQPTPSVTKKETPKKPESPKPTSEKITEAPPKVPTAEVAPPKPGPTVKGVLDEESWQAVLKAIKAKHNTLYSVTRMAVPSFQGKELILAFSFPFHQKRLSDAKNRQIISDVIKQTTGQSVTINCVVDINARTKPAATTSPQLSKSAETISNIFGGGEMLE